MDQGRDAMFSPIWLALVLTITDGDTFRARIQTLPQQYAEVAVRIRGIDTPETSHLAKCEKEKVLGRQAKKALSVLIENQTVALTALKPDKYGGRYDAIVHVRQNIDVGGELLKRGLAATYHGSGPKHDWCGNNH